MKVKTKKSLKRIRKNIKRKTNRHHRGSSQENFIVEFDGIRVAGQEFTKAKTVSQPSIKFPTSDNLYTLIMWDPDVPPQSQPGWAHWIAINLQSPNDIFKNQLLPYMGPSPPSETHRYFFGLFIQHNTINPQQPSRANFNINKFIIENNLEKKESVFMKVSAT